MTRRFLYSIALLSLLNVATFCGCPDPELLFFDDFEDCGGVPCGWAAEVGTISSDGGLRLEDGATASRAVAIEFPPEEFWFVEFSTQCEPGARVELDVIGPESIATTVSDGRLRSDFDEGVRVELGWRRGSLVVDELRLSASGGACSVGRLNAITVFPCD